MMPCSHVFQDAVVAGWFVCTQCGMQATCKQCGRQAGRDVAAWPHVFCARHVRAGMSIGFSLHDIGVHCIALARALPPSCWGADTVVVDVGYCLVRVTQMVGTYLVFVTPAGKTIPSFHAVGTQAGCRLVYGGGVITWVVPLLQCLQFLPEQVMRVSDVVAAS